MRKRPENITRRIWFVVGAIGIGTAAVTGRLIDLQIVHHGKYAEQARITHLGEETISDRRGAILDRNGYPLTGSQDSFDVMVEKRAWEDSEDAAEAANAISEITNVTPEEAFATVAASEIYEIAVARGLNWEQSQKLRDLHLPGVRLIDSSKRVYPEGNLAAQLLGFVGRDGVGLTGLEYDLDEVLGGAKGTLTYERDGLGRQLPLGAHFEVAPQPGANVVLTIDRYIQRLAERELTSTIEKHKAKGGTIIVVQPKTGEVLAMASQPSADVTNPDLGDESKVALFRNRAITDEYEPGSVFKLVTMAAALDTGVATPGTWWYDEGKFTADSWTIRNWDNRAYGDLTVQDILTYSLNTGAAYLSTLTGPDRFYNYVDAFGFGKPTDIGLSGEVPGQVRTHEQTDVWRSVDLATNSFGQGITATPLQVVMAAAAIANDGLMMKPQIVKEIAYPGNRQVVASQAGNQVITPETSRTLRDMMGVVANGIAKSLLDVRGYSVGGKTGTANLVQNGGGYKPDAYISSFVGVAPLEDPELAVLVKIDEPQGVPWGTVVAAPAFGRLVDAALAYMKVPAVEEPAAVAELD